MATVCDVAKYILKKTGQISTFKLQKLIYYSQAWSLVFDDQVLFKCKIYAWSNGPVCRSLYEKHKGKFLISSKDIDGDCTNLKPYQKETIDMVIDTYGGFSGQELSNLTHREAPWKNARKGLKPGERGEVEISLNDMVEYYSAILAEQQTE